MRTFIHRLSPLWSGSRVASARARATACHVEAYSALSRHHSKSWAQAGAGLLDYAAVVGCISIIVMIGMTLVGHRTADHYCEGGRVLKLECHEDENGNEICRPPAGRQKAFWDDKKKCCAIKITGGGLGSPAGGTHCLEQ